MAEAMPGRTLSSRVDHIFSHSRSNITQQRGISKLGQGMRKNALRTCGGKHKARENKRERKKWVQRGVSGRNERRREEERHIEHKREEETDIAGTAPSRVNNPLGLTRWGLPYTVYSSGPPSVGNNRPCQFPCSLQHHQSASSVWIWWCFVSSVANVPHKADPSNLILDLFVQKLAAHVKSLILF